METITADIQVSRPAHEEIKHGRRRQLGPRGIARWLVRQDAVSLYDFLLSEAYGILK